ncbi:MAG: hypothetical protein H6Q73_577 [Firmicutes bacterium]|nr:hypothetical protein [Bacillota bacterium]
MLGYVVGGAAVGIVIGHLIPPGHFFWFTVGAIGGCLAQRYLYRKY